MRSLINLILTIEEKIFSFLNKKKSKETYSNEQKILHGEEASKKLRELAEKYCEKYKPTLDFGCAPVEDVMSVVEASEIYLVRILLPQSSLPEDWEKKGFIAIVEAPGKRMKHINTYPGSSIEEIYFKIDGRDKCLWSYHSVGDCAYN